MNRRPVFLQVGPLCRRASGAGPASTLQLWMQIVGKIRLALMPPINHCWGVTFYPTVRGVTTSPMPYGNRTLQIDFDFVDHVLLVEASGAGRKTIPLKPMTVAAFYGQVMHALESVGTPVRIWPMPVEVAEPIRFEKDDVHKEYDAEYVQRLWRILLETTRVFTIFRARFRGKVSPVHLFWGAMDLACTRFSGRTAPEHASMPGLADRVTRDAYSHEVSSCGFWPGMAGPPGAPDIEPLFYSYAYPEPPGYRDYSIAPALGGFDANFGEFVLPYEAMRNSTDPDAALLAFLQSTYEAASNCAKWDRAALDCA